MFTFLIHHYSSKDCPFMLIPEMLAIFFGLPLDAGAIVGVVCLFKYCIL